MRRRGRVWQMWAVAAVTTMTPLAARAANPFLDDARLALEKLEYDRVTPLLQKALKVAEDPGQEAEIYELLATMHVAYDHPGKAIAAFVEVLHRRPDYRPAADASPKLVDAFNDALVRIEAEQTSAPGLKPPPPAALSPPTPDVPPPAPPAESLTHFWWFWTAVGVAATAAVASVSVAIVHRPVVAPTHDYGPYELP